MFRPQVRATQPMADWDGVRTARAIAAGEVSAVEVVEAAITRAGDIDPALDALTTPAFEAARAAAAAVDRLPRPRGKSALLAGVPTVIKDLSEWTGHRTTFGTRASGNHISGRNSPEVVELLRTGLIPIGKSSAPEHGMIPTTEPLGFPATRNPWNVEHSTGGSSGGSAALVAAGIVPVGHATDGGGSIRIPAACCGLVGLKPSDRRMVDLEGNRQIPVHLLANSVVTRTVRDTAAYVAAVEHTAPSPVFEPVGHVTEPTADRLNVGVVLSSTIADIDPQVRQAGRFTADALSDLGHRVTEIRLPYDEERLADDFILYWGLLATTLAPMDRVVIGRAADTGLFEPWTRGLARNSVSHAVELPAAIWRLRRAKRDYAALMSRYHVLVNPTVATPPPRLGWLDVTLPFEDLLARAYAFTPFAAMFNVVGAPAVSLPMALSTEGLPLGMQFAAAAGEERVLLEVALALEDSVGFNRVR